MSCRYFQFDYLLFSLYLFPLFFFLAFIIIHIITADYYSSLFQDREILFLFLLIQGDPGKTYKSPARKILLYEKRKVPSHLTKHGSRGGRARASHKKSQCTLLMFILEQFFGQIRQILAARFARRLPFGLLLPFFPWPNLENFRGSLRSPERDNGWSGGDAPTRKFFLDPCLHLPPHPGNSRDSSPSIYYQGFL